MAIYRLARRANDDILELLAYTEMNFGNVARFRYEMLLVTALRDIALEPERIGSLARPEIGESIRTYHLGHSRERARSERGVVMRPRHLLLYRARGNGVIGVGRVLHDAMDIVRHLPTEYGDE